MPPSRRRFRERPSWWPEGEPWPPATRYRRRMGLRFLIRLMLLLFVMGSLVFGLASAGFYILLSLIGAAPSGPPFHAPAFVGPFIAVLIALAFFYLIRGTRRIALPLGDLIDAAERLAQGDYTARVAEQGTREMRTLASTFNAMAARLQANEQQRRALLADVSHELRTPLTVMQGNLEGMVDGVYPLDREHLEPLLDEMHVLSRLIEDLRTLALAESGALALKKEQVDVGVLAAETVASFRPQAEAAGIGLTAEGDDLPAVWADPARIREVLTNLLTNALRYTPRGGRIEVRCLFESAAPRVTVSVSDNGAGIPADELPHIFDRFYKSRDSGGSGLGLAIARGLVIAHGGEIAAESAPGGGTTIRFTLPAGP